MSIHDILAVYWLVLGRCY